MKSIKYSKYLAETSKNYKYISYNRVNPASERKREKIRYSLKDAATILKPYVAVRFNDQFKVVVPISLLAEPALNALGITVENLTNGAFGKKLVMISVSIGVSLGLAFGVLKIIFNIPLMHIIVPLYLIAIVLTVISEERYVNIGWDSAGVTTGPITVPLVLALGLGFAKATNSLDGFGVLALASVFPILSVLSVGLYVQYLEKKAGKEQDYV